MLLWIGCVAGALGDHEYRSEPSAAGFEQIAIEPTRIYRAEDARDFLAAAGRCGHNCARGACKILSAFVRAVKPTRAEEKTCCGPSGC
jgi:arsenite methyltransferase